MKKFPILDKKILSISNKEYKYFLAKTNVVGVGLGYKIKKGFCTFKKCIKVFVIKKIPCNIINEKHLIPTKYKGIQTDVIESGIPIISSLTNRIRPVTGGYSIGPYNIEIGGTFGCLVTDGKYYYVLSNNHVLASQGLTPIGANIIQPNKKDGGVNPQDTIATLSKYIPIYYIEPTAQPENEIDCAIAKITKRSQVSTKITFLGRIKGVSSAVLGSNVQKVGKTTELTKGNITAIGSTLIINFQIGLCLFKNQIVTSKMSTLGDSGAILLDNNMHALGLFCAHTSSQSIINPIDAVLKNLNVNIVTGDFCCRYIK